MRTLVRTTLSAALLVAPLMAIGCSSLPNRMANSRAIQQRDVKLNNARMEESLGHYQVAKRLYEEVGRQDPRNVECVHRLAVVCTRLNQHAAAEDYFRQANSLSPDNPEILADMGYSAFVQKDYVRSESFLEASIKLRDTDKRTLTNLAIVRAWRKKDDSSLEMFRRVSSESEALKNLAAIQIARGDKELGTKNYELAKSGNAPPRELNGEIAQTSSNDQPKQVVDVPPPPPDASKTVRSASASGDEAPLPPAAPENVIKITPQTTALVQIPILGSASHPVPNSVPPSPSCASTAGPECPVIAPNPPLQIQPSYDGQPVVPGPDVLNPAPPEKPVKDDDLTSQPPKEVVKQLVSLEAAVEQPLLEPETDVLYEPVIARPDADEVVRTGSPLRANPNPVTVWRKTAAPAQPLIAEAPQRLEEVGGKTTSSSGSYAAASPLSKLPLATINQSSAEQAVPTIQKEEERSGTWKICLVTLFEEKRLVPAASEFSIEHQSQEFRFASAEAMEKFRANPQKYIPVAGGLDVVCVRNQKGVIQGSLNFALWYHHQLYLFSSQENADEFRRSPGKYVTSK